MLCYAVRLPIRHGPGVLWRYASCAVHLFIQYSSICICISELPQRYTISIPPCPCCAVPTPHISPSTSPPPLIGAISHGNLNNPLPPSTRSRLRLRYPWLQAHQPADPSCLDGTISPQGRRRGVGSRWLGVGNGQQGGAAGRVSSACPLPVVWFGTRVGSRDGSLGLGRGIGRTSPCRHQPAVQLRSNYQHTAPTNLQLLTLLTLPNLGPGAR